MVVIHLREVLVDFSGFEMSLYPVLNRMKANIMYLKTLQAGYLTARNIDSFTDEN